MSASKRIPTLFRLKVRSTPSGCEVQLLRYVQDGEAVIGLVAARAVRYSRRDAIAVVLAHYRLLRSLPGATDHKHVQYATDASMRHVATVSREARESGLRAIPRRSA